MARTRKQKVIAHHLDGTLVKGTTTDFAPKRQTFTIKTDDGSHKIKVADLKAVFFVKEFKGRPEYRERKGFFDESTKGSKILVEFLDGEILFGYTSSFSEKGVGFFMVPGDPDSNNINVFVVYVATRRVKLKTLNGDAESIPAGSSTSPE
jgi:hypothetical protein